MDHLLDLGGHLHYHLLDLGGYGGHLRHHLVYLLLDQHLEPRSSNQYYVQPDFSPYHLDDQNLTTTAQHLN